MATAAAAKDEQTAHRFAKDQLKAFVERVERLEEEKKAIADDIRDVYAEAKGNGFDVKALRTIVRLRKQDIDERKEQEAILETYMHALGMIVFCHCEEQSAKQSSRCRTQLFSRAAMTKGLLHDAVRRVGDRGNEHDRTAAEMIVAKSGIRIGGEGHHHRLAGLTIRLAS